MGDEIRCQRLADLLKPKNHFARFDSSQEAQMTTFEGQQQSDAEGVLPLGRWRNLFDGQRETKDVNDLEG